jgi:hypothetical protein
MNKRTGRERRDRRNRREKTAAIFLMGSLKSVEERKDERRKKTRAPRILGCSHFDAVQNEEGGYCPDCGAIG